MAERSQQEAERPMALTPPGEEREPAATAPRWSSHALEWGLASVFLGLLVLVVCVLGGVGAGVGLGLHFSRPSNFSIREVREAFDVGAAAVALLMAVVAVGLLFGIRGIWLARARKLPAAIPAAGIVLCSMFVVALAVTLVVVLVEKEDTIKLLEQKGHPKTLTK
jgi:hypothetical protein